MTTAYEYAALSLDVYYDASDPKRPPLPSGWIRFQDAKNCSNGYFGACYINEASNPIRLVIAHRGTVFTN